MGGQMQQQKQNNNTQNSTNNQINQNQPLLASHQSHAWNNNSWSYNLSYVQIWLSLLLLGHNNITKKALLSQDLVCKFVKRLSANKNIDISVKQSDHYIQENFKSFKDFAKSALGALGEMNKVRPILVCFRLAPTESIRNSITKPLGNAEEVTVVEKVEEVENVAEEPKKPTTKKKKS